MDTEGQTYEQAMLEQARRQTTALESLRGTAMVLMALLALGALTWIFLAFAS